MRSLALFALFLAVASPRTACERPNPENCESDQNCSPDQICADRRCTTPECQGPDNCPAERSLCVSRRCQPCTLDDHCRGRTSATGTPLPFCQGGAGCVECNEKNACARDPQQAICDPASFQCRGCQEHRECASGVCAKDDLLADLPAGKGLARGICVPADRVLLVDSSDVTCNGAGRPVCLLSQALERINVDRPYVRVLNAGHSFTFPLLIPSPLASPDLKVVHVIGPTADTPPSRLVLPPLWGMVMMNMPAVTISPGYRVVLEGLALQGGNPGIECSGGGMPDKSEVRLLRSVIGETEVAVRVNGCALTLEQTWIGKGPQFVPVLSRLRMNNLRTLEIKDANFNIINSVLWQNGVPGTYGGINIIETAGRSRYVSRIVNSTVYGHDYPSPLGAGAVECNIDLSGRLAIINTYILNTSLGGPGQPAFQVGTTCRPEVTRVASNDAQLASEGLVVRAESDDFSEPQKGDLHLIGGGAARTGGQGSVKLADDKGVTQEVVPPVDMDGVPRGRLQGGQVSVGAFEARQ